MKNITKKFNLLFFLSFFLFLCLPLFSYAVDIASWCGCLVLDAVCFLRCIANYLLSLPIRIFAAVIVTLFYLVAFIAILFAWIAELLAGLLIMFSLQNAYNNQFYGIWLEVRNAAMWLIAVFLAFIGIATILRIESYGAKKALFPLILVAFFLNFLPWITRTIIHIGNSFTVFFFSRLGNLRGQLSAGQGQPSTAQIEIGIIGTNVFNTLKETLNQLGDAILTIFTIDGRFMEAFFQVVQLDNGETRGPYILSIALIIVGAAFAAVFWIMYTFIILGIGFYFVVRTAYLWILFIISPLPFVTLPFSHTREIKSAFPGPLNWEGWFTQLLHWAFMGVPISFFVFIAGYLATMSPGVLPGNIDFNSVATNFSRVSTGPGTGGTGPAGFVDPLALQTGIRFNEILNSTFRYIPAVVALSLGISISPGLMGSGLRRLWDVAKGFAMGSVVTGALMGGAFARRATAPLRRRMAPLAKKIPEPVRSRARAVIDRARPYTEYAKKQLGKLSPVEEWRKAREEVEEAKLESYEKMATSALNRIAQTKGDSLSAKEKAKILEVLTKKGALEEQTLKALLGGKTLEELNRLYGEKLVRQIITQNPQWTAGTIINSRTGKAFTLEEIMDTFSPDEVENLSAQALQNANVLGYVLQDERKAMKLRTLSLNKRRTVYQNITMGEVFAYDKLADFLNRQWGTSITGAQIRHAVATNDWKVLSQQLSPTQLKELQNRVNNIRARAREIRNNRVFL